ncbi:MAG: subclass B1 metallo-beta-lactamase [Ignavibacteriales bacterium]|nr:subclass B1 metallo-beta-lactamase [Ignavibacteriales bacterium]
MKKLIVTLFLINVCLFAADKVELRKINDSVWIHTTYKLYNGYPTPSNGLVVVTALGLVLIDTPWDNPQTEELIKICKEKFNKYFVLAIITHCHEDRIGGISSLKKNNIRVISSALTAKLAKEKGYETPYAFTKSDTLLVVDKTIFELYYPGAAHTIDNIVVWLPNFKLLFGGCMFKSEMSESLGNIADADVKEWSKSIKNVVDKFPDIKAVIPGHGKWGGRNLILHTLALLKRI